ncbi:MAG: hypothetical protein Q7S31_01445 [bacterium]|nr:hypothetical protein [bacterium]
MAKGITTEGFRPDPEPRRMPQSPDDFRFLHPLAESGIVELDGVTWKVCQDDSDPGATVLVALSQYLKLN